MSKKEPLKKKKKKTFNYKTVSKEETMYASYKELTKLCNKQQTFIKAADKLIKSMLGENQRMREHIMHQEGWMELCSKELNLAYNHLTHCNNPGHEKFLDKKINTNIKKWNQKH
jgi:hypothetical protein